MWVKHNEFVDLLRRAVEGAAQAHQLAERLADAKTQIADLKHELELERARANAAVDAMLVGRGNMPITPSEVPNPDHLFEEDPQELQRMTQAIANDGLVAVLDEAR